MPILLQNVCWPNFAGHITGTRYPMILSKFKTESHFYHPGKIDKILAILDGFDLDTGKLSIRDIAGADEFYVRGTEVSKELAREIYLHRAKVLDVGCGAGGTCRMLAVDFGCRVTGIDINLEYIRTAEKLSELTGLSNKTVFIQANALDLPFDDGSFDIIWAHHIQMDISDKKKFFSEIRRVLNNEGAFVFYDVFKKELAHNPAPALRINNSATNFLESFQSIDKILLDLGFVNIQSRDQTIKARQFLFNFFDQDKKRDALNMRHQMMMSNSVKKKLNALLKRIEERKIELYSGIYRKRGIYDKGD